MISNLNLTWIGRTIAAMGIESTGNGEIGRKIWKQKEAVKFRVPDVGATFVARAQGAEEVTRKEAPPFVFLLLLHLDVPFLLLVAHGHLSRVRMLRHG